MAKQEKRISYRAGITRTPSDFLCQDVELAECINLTTDNEELKPMVQPTSHMSGAPTILYIHKFNVEKRYITRTNDTISWGRNVSGVYTEASGGAATLLTVSGEAKVTSLGKYLTIADSTGLHSFLWKGDGYETLPDIPKPDVEFFLLGNDNYHIHFERETDITVNSDTHEIVDNEKFNDLAIGIYSKNKNAINQKKAFCLPFFVRTALQLKDGSYTHISQPILLFPSLTENTHITYAYWDGDTLKRIKGDTYYRKLYFINKSNINHEICKSIVVFVSAPIDIYDTIVDQAWRGTSCIHDGIYRERTDGISEMHSETVGTSKNMLVKRPVNEIENDIKSASIYYKLCEIDLVGDSQNGNTVPHDIGEKIDTHTLETLTAQSRLDQDDYYSFCPLKASFLYCYNSRLNLANVERGFFEGYDFFMPYDDVRDYDYYIYVRIKTDQGNRVVRHRVTTCQKMGYWFYYPDPRADWVTIRQRLIDGSDGNVVLDAALTEHHGLNGAYYFNGYPTGSNVPPASTATLGSGDLNNTFELLPNYILQSEVNNPFVFRPAGYFKVETGEIYAMSTITQALSQGQFGQYPLLVFSENGIWSLSVATTGYYASIYPMSREVCINPNMVTQTDGAVFFVSKKGLMVIVGNDVSCVSERMNGRAFNTSGVVGVTGNAAPWASIITACQDPYTFLDYIRDAECRMAYDYIDSRLLIINHKQVTVNNASQNKYNFAYVYNMADGTISKTVLPANMDNVVNDYPDYLLQSGTSVYTLYNKPREEEILTRQKAFLMTRPMKLAGPLTVASLRELVNVGTWQKKDALGTELSKVKTELWLSDDMVNWHLMSSRFGAAAKYFRIGLFIDMLPTERLSGTILKEQERRTDNERV